MSGLRYQSVAANVPNHGIGLSESIYGLTEIVKQAASTLLLINILKYFFRSKFVIKTLFDTFGNVAYAGATD